MKRFQLLKEWVIDLYNFFGPYMFWLVTFLCVLWVSLVVFAIYAVFHFTIKWW